MANLATLNLKRNSFPLSVIIYPVLFIAGINSTFTVFANKDILRSADLYTS